MDNFKEFENETRFQLDNAQTDKKVPNEEELRAKQRMDALALESLKEKNLKKNQDLQALDNINSRFSKLKKQNDFKLDQKIKKEDEKTDVVLDSARKLNDSPEIIGKRQQLIEERYSQYAQSSDRYYRIVKTLDSAITKLLKTGRTGSDTYVAAVNSIWDFRKLIFKIDGKKAEEGNAKQLITAYDQMKTAVNAAVRRYEAKGIKSTFKTGGKRRVIFEELSALMDDTLQENKNPGELYTDVTDSVNYEQKRENELADGTYSIDEKKISEFEEIGAKIEERIKPYEDLMTSGKFNVKKTSIDGKLRELNDVYSNYVYFIHTMNNPPISKLQKWTNDKRIAKWNKIREKTKDRDYKSYKPPYKSIDPSVFNFSVNTLTGVNDSIEKLKNHLAAIKNSGEGTEKGWEAAQNLINSLDELSKLHDHTMKEMDENAWYLPKGSPEEIERIFEKTKAAARLVARLGKKNTNTEIKRIAEGLGDSMTKGELSHKFGELLIVLSHIDSSAYDSPESLEAPYSDKEMADKIKPLGKKDDIKQIDKRNIQKSIDFLTRVSSGYLEQNAIKNEYKIVDRKGWATTENGPAFDEDQLAVDKAIDKKYAVAKRIIEDADIYMMLEDLDFTSMVEFYVTLNRQQQRCRNLFIKEYEKRRKNDIFFRENHTKDEIKRHNKSIAYEILTGTALGKMTMATNYLVSNTNCSLMSNGYPFLATTLSTRLDRMVRIRKKVGINQFVENGNKKISKINGESITSVADFVRDGESYIAAKEHQHVERLFEDAIRGKGLKAAQIKSYKTIPAQPV